MKVTKLLLTEAQQAVMDILAERLNSAPRAEIVAVHLDVDIGPEMRLVSTTRSALVFYLGGLLMLRSALSALAEQQQYPRAAEMLEAVRTALPFLESADITQERTPAGMTN